MEMLPQVNSGVCKTIASVFAIAMIAGCSTLPNLSTQLKNDPKGDQSSRIGFGVRRRPPTVADLVQRIQCEIRDSIKTNPGTELVEDEYIAAVTLTADISVNDGATPSLSFISPHTQSRNLTNLLGAQWTGTQHKQFTQNFSLDLSKPKVGLDDKVSGERCANAELKGSLGLQEIIQAGLPYGRVNGPSHEQLIFEMPGASCDDKAAGAVSDASRPVFGSTIDFTVVFGVNGGPTWTLLQLKGPAGGSSGWLNFANTEKNTLVISFAPALPGGEISPDALKKLAKNGDCNKQKKFDPTYTSSSFEQGYIYKNFLPQQQSDADASRVSAKGDAARSAQQNNTQMILQNLLLQSH